MTDQFITDDFLRVLIALKNNIMVDCNVCELAKVESISSDTYNCKIFSTNGTIQAKALKDLEISVDDIVLVIFTNTDYRTNLTRAKNNQATEVINSEKMHNKSYGIIIGIL